MNKSLFGIFIFGFFLSPLQAQWSNQGQNAPQPTKEIQQNKEINKTETVYKKGFDVKRISVGGGIGLQFGTVTAIELSPVVSYRFHKMFSAGINLQYSYYKNSFYSPAIKHSIYGGGVLARFYPIKWLFIHAEIQALNQEIWSANDPAKTKRGTVFYPMAGLGYNQVIGDRSGLYLMLLWNFNNVSYSVYPNPILEIGFDIGI
ncbi:MAG: hypothetical protein RR256_04275 [Bacteroidales bacterium]